MYSAVELARNILKMCVEDGHPISNLQLQKILYFVQVDFLKNTGRPIFSDQIEAWRFGPVVPNAYYEFCCFGGMAIPDIPRGPYANLLEKEEIRLSGLVNEKRKLSAWEMVEQTHREDGAWYRVYNKGKGNRMVISLDLIRNHG